ncbi:MAG: response regulator [Lachnospiraceae bacterium]|nr:response regulator [Lachnospiraceae bacterium]
MIGRKKRERKVTDRNKSPFWILFLLALFAAAGIAGSRMVLLKNADYMGKKLVESYAKEEELNIGIYANMVRIGMSYINDQTEDGESQEKVEEWITSYFEKTRDSMEGNDADAYAVVDGKVIADKPQNDIESYDYANEVWYRQAMEARGEVILTDVFEDSVSGSQVITIAAANPDTGNAVAFDLFPENFEKSHEDLQLFENSSYYVCDSVGEVIFQRASFDVSEEKVLEYVKELYRKIESGEMDEPNSTIRDLDGKKRGVYYCYTMRGWLCILTIPLEALYENLYEVYIYYAVIAIVAVVIMALIWIRDRRLRRYIKDKNDTIHMLGNSYYAIYRIEMESSTYEMTKGSEYVRKRLPYSGPYENLLNVLVSCMDKETGQDFAKSFSMENIVALAKEGTKDFGGDFHRLFGDEYRWVNVRLVQDPVHSPGEAVLCFREVEEEKQRQFQSMSLMEDALAAADASEKSQKQFFSSMSHDMRTPLNVIIGMADLGLRKECSREKMAEYLEKISVSSKQLLTLINDILEMSRLEQGKIDLDNRVFNVCDTLKLCVAPFEIQAENEGKKFEVNIDVQAPMVCGDPSRLTQILNNLISNAVKFTESGDSITVNLRQIKRSKHGRYVFVVKDTGAGMSEEFLPHLYEPYEREKRFDVQKVTGTGLGMPIVKNLVSQMGGEITVDSILGKGTRFVIMLPLSVSSLEPVTEKVENDFGKLEGKHVLLAEDNPLNREIVTELLSMKGMEISVAENGREALEKFAESEEFSYDVILMDVQMPEMDGCEAAGKIRALNRTDAKVVPIIALTANAFPEDIARTAAAGMNAHLCKPIEPEILWATLQQVQN